MKEFFKKLFSDTISKTISSIIVTFILTGGIASIFSKKAFLFISSILTFTIPLWITLLISVAFFLTVFISKNKIKEKEEENTRLKQKVSNGEDLKRGSGITQEEKEKIDLLLKDVYHKGYQENFKSSCQTIIMDSAWEGNNEESFNYFIIHNIFQMVQIYPNLPVLKVRFTPFDLKFKDQFYIDELRRNFPNPTKKLSSFWK